MRCENLKFYGLKDEQNVTWEQFKGQVRKYLSQVLNVNVSDMGIERVHRLPGRSSPRPIIVKFSHFKDKDLVLKKYRARRKELQEANVADIAAGENSEDGATSAQMVSE